jgi:DNA-binding MarR family transcriptional regulator
MWLSSADAGLSPRQWRALAVILEKIADEVVELCLE